MKLRLLVIFGVFTIAASHKAADHEDQLKVNDAAFESEEEASYRRTQM